MNPRRIKLLATDYDDCLLNFLDGREDSLSEHLIKHMLANGYTGVYACTHRCFKNFYGDSLARRWKSIKKLLKRYHPQDPANYFTSRITSNLKAVLEPAKIEFLHVSTVDDVIIDNPDLSPAEKCGFSYKNILEPYEIELLNNNPNLAVEDLTLIEYKPEHLFIDKLLFIENSQSKNLQLMQIANHAKEKFCGDAEEEVEIEIHFFDDKIDLCRKIEKLKDHEKDFPDNVIVKSFQHLPRKGIIVNQDTPPVAIFQKNSPVKIPPSAPLGVAIPRLPLMSLLELAPVVSVVISLILHIAPLAPVIVTKNICVRCCTALFDCMMWFCSRPPPPVASTLKSINIESSAAIYSQLSISVDRIGGGIEVEKKENKVYIELKSSADSTEVPSPEIEPKLVSSIRQRGLM